MQRAWTARSLVGLLGAVLLATASAGCDSSPSALPRDGGAVAESPLRDAGADPAACGNKGLPDCPTQAWMKGNLRAFLTAGDMPRLAAALDRLASAAPPGYEGWAAESKAGADAARKGDI